MQRFLAMFALIALAFTTAMMPAAPAFAAPMRECAQASAMPAAEHAGHHQDSQRDMAGCCTATPAALLASGTNAAVPRAKPLLGTRRIATLTGLHPTAEVRPPRA